MSQSGVGKSRSCALAAAGKRISALKKEQRLTQVVTVFWRDIPAQVMVGKGRRAAKVQLPERFEQAIDRCAMKIGAKGDDAYLAEWRKAAAEEPESGDDATVAASVAARIDAEYDAARLRALIANDGWNEAR